MMDPFEALDRQRDRWRRARHALHLNDPESVSFGLDALGSRVCELSVRLVILPPDPELHLVEFDDELEKWWRSDSADPITGAAMRWGTSYTSSASTAIRYDWADDVQFNRYIGLRRDGGVDMGLGRDGAWRQENVGLFRLTAIVGRVWCACHLYGEVAKRIGVGGPCELSLGLLATSKDVLADFGEGWAEPGTGWYTTRPTTKQNLLLRREVDALTEDWPQRLAFSFGAQIEDAFGSNSRRFKAHRGECAGQFDHRRYRW